MAVVNRKEIVQAKKQEDVVMSYYISAYTTKRLTDSIARSREKIPRKNLR